MCEGNVCGCGWFGEYWHAHARMYTHTHSHSHSGYIMCFHISQIYTSQRVTYSARYIQATAPSAACWKWQTSLGTTVSQSTTSALTKKIGFTRKSEQRTPKTPRDTNRTHSPLPASVWARVSCSHLASVWTRSCRRTWAHTHTHIHTLFEMKCLAVFCTFSWNLKTILLCR